MQLTTSQQLFYSKNKKHMTTWGTHLMPSITLFPLLHPKILAVVKLTTALRKNYTVRFAGLK